MVNLANVAVWPRVLGLWVNATNLAHEAALDLKDRISLRSYDPRVTFATQMEEHAWLAFDDGLFQIRCDRRFDGGLRPVRPGTMPPFTVEER